jgi:hypothetical protein
MKYLTFCVLASVVVVASIPGMIVSLVAGNWFIAIPCILFVVSGFYGLPFIWLGYAAARFNAALTRSVTVNNVTNIAELSTIYGMKDRQMRQSLMKLVQKGHLDNYKFSADGKELVQVQKKQEPVWDNKCPYCGAAISVYAEVCGYCKNVIKRK